MFCVYSFDKSKYISGVSGCLEQVCKNLLLFRNYALFVEKVFVHPIVVFENDPKIQQHVYVTITSQ